MQLSRLTTGLFAMAAAFGLTVIMGAAALWLLTRNRAAFGQAESA